MLESQGRNPLGKVLVILRILARYEVEIAKICNFVICSAGPLSAGGYVLAPCIASILTPKWPMPEPFILNSAYECNSFRWASEQAQILTELIIIVDIESTLLEQKQSLPDWFQILH